MNDVDLLLEHLYEAAYSYEIQSRTTIDEKRKAYLVGQAKGLITACHVVQELYNIEIQFNPPPQEQTNEDT